ncbi:hypothetical protein [Pseudorhodoplanes sp.]|uniref:hypothetical protein n=1 Tax=Pseudorhodoplanes sp. TaxID=1934341 RepID=UPI002B85E175|nr:hypothetical protein [Pseudorhodoplanes sp.]HWV51869.1 hypothetical protein [Pseudorhodoplanes sp.]
MSSRRYTIAPLITLAAAFLAGCAGHEAELHASRPGKFQLYSCDQLNQEGTKLLQRERELADLMQRARQGTGGELAVAIAYQNEYNTVAGDLRQIETTGGERNCTLKYRTAAERAVR